MLLSSRRVSPPPDALPTADRSEVRVQRLVLGGLLALGVFVRLFHFFHNRALYIDELFLNVSLLSKSYWELVTTPLEYEQKAPVGYLWAVRFFVILLGKQEPALRLFSLLCGLGSLFLFVPVARFFLKGWGVVLAVGAVALAYPMVYQAVTAKQYSAELLATILALLLYINYRDSSTLPAFVAWGVLGGLLLWFSFPTIFILASIGLIMCLQAALRQEWRRFALSLIPPALWGLNFGIIYHLFVGKYKNSGWLTYFFKYVYAAYPPLNGPQSLKWLLHKAHLFLDDSLGLLLRNDHPSGTLLKHFVELSWVTLPLIGAGIYYLFRNQRQHFALLFVPIGLTLAAAAVEQYPFHERFTLFLTPAVVLALGYGLQQLINHYQPRAGLIYAVLALALLAPLVNSARQVLTPDLFYNNSYPREVLFYVNERFQPGDAVYVYWNMRPGYEYYKAAYGLKYTAVKASYVKNSSTGQQDYINHLKPDFEAFAGKRRLWFVYDSDNLFPIGDYAGRPTWYYNQAFLPGQLVNDYFATQGKRVDFFHKKHFSVTLYELAEKSK